MSPKVEPRRLVPRVRARLAISPVVNSARGISNSYFLDNRSNSALNCSWVRLSSKRVKPIFGKSRIIINDYLVVDSGMSSVSMRPANSLILAFISMLKFRRCVGSSFQFLPYCFLYRFSISSGPP